MAYINTPMAHGTPTLDVLRWDRHPGFGQRHEPRVNITVEDATLALSPGEALALRAALDRALEAIATDPPAAWGPQPGYGEMTEDEAATASAYLMDHPDVLSLGVTADGRPCGYLDSDTTPCATVAFAPDGQPYLLIRPEDQHPDEEAA